MSKRPGPAFTVECVAPNSHIIRFDDIRAGWEQWVMLSSDRHHDNMQCLQDYEREHLQLAAERNAVILDGGDLFCAMQGKYDPRSSMSSLRPEHKVDNYLDALVKTAATFYGPYARNLAVLTHGNHETSILRRHGCDLTSNLVSRLNADHSGRCMAAAFSNWVTFQFSVHKTVRRTLKLKIAHGQNGTDAPVTRGVIASNRMAAKFPDADYVMSGHSHDQWCLPIKRERIGAAGEVTYDIAWHIRTPTYKDEYAGGEGFQVEKGTNFKPLGCVWIKFYLADSTAGYVVGTPMADVR